MMTRRVLAEYLAPCLLAGGLAVLPAVASAQQAQAKFVDLEGAENGTAVLTPVRGGVMIGLEVTGLPPAQWAAFHVHEGGSCDHASQHESAREHFNPSGVEHGFLSRTGPHAGDMPNIWVDDAGMARAEVFNPYISLAEGENNVRGRTLMIHAGVDDYETQPSGAAGDRLACAVIE